jgi:hypothetical protein
MSCGFDGALDGIVIQIQGAAFTVWDKLMAA